MALQVTGSINVSGSIESNELSGSVSGSFQGDGSKLTGVGGTNPTTGSMPLNISGSFVDSPITAQNAGFTPNANNGITYTEVTPNNIFVSSGNICISDLFLGISPSFGTAFEASSLGGNGFEIIALNDNGTVGPFIESNYNNNNPLQSSLASLTTPFPVTYTDGDGDILTVRIDAAANNSGIIYMGGTGNNAAFQPSDFIDGNGSYNEGSGVTSPTTLAFGGVEAEAGTTVTSPLTVTQNVSIGGTIGTIGDSTTSLTLSEINLITNGSGIVVSKGNVDYIQFNTGQATNLVDNQTYSALTLGASSTYPSNDPSTYTREWVYLAEGNSDLNLGVGSSILYTDNPNFNTIVDDTGNRNLNDYNSPAGLGQLDVGTVVGSGGALTTTGDMSVTGDLTVGVSVADPIIVGGGSWIIQNNDTIDSPGNDFTTIPDGASVELSGTVGASPSTETVIVASTTNQSITFTTNIAAYDTLQQITVSQLGGVIGNLTVTGTIGNPAASGSASFFVEDSGALPNAEGAFKFKIADNGDTGTTGYITFVRE